jgi:hypothetical protein
MKKIFRLAAVLWPLLALSVPAGADIHFGLVDSDDHHYYRSSGLSSFEVRYSGDIELSPDQEHIVSISPGGFLEIETRRLFTLRRLRATPSPNGAPEVHYWRADRRGTDAEARDFLERHLPEAVRVTAIGARAQARRLLASGGPRAVLSALGDRDSEEAQEIFLQTIIKSGPIDSATGAEMIRAAARQISGSSRLSRILVTFAQKLPSDPELTGKLARACEEISSSSKRREALCRIGDARGIPPASADEYARAVSGISSSSEKAAAIEHLASLTAEPRAISALAGAADTIESSAARRQALRALALRPGLPGETLARVIRTGEGISSSAEKAGFLAEAAPVSLAPEAVHAYLRACETIESSAEKRHALVALLSTHLSKEAWISTVRTGARIESSAEKAGFLVAAAGYPTMDSSTVSAYLECAGSIESSAEKRRAAVALLRHGLTPDQASLVTRFAEHEISSSSEREAVLREATNGKS